MRGFYLFAASSLLLLVCSSGMRASHAFQGLEADHPRFEVASIKVYKSAERPNFSGGSCRGKDSTVGRNAPIVPPIGRCILIGTLTKLLDFAYADRDFAGLPPSSPTCPSCTVPISGSPNWADTDKFDIEAEADDSAATEAQLREMFKNLLADRFALKFHWDMKDEGGYALVVSKSGQKMTPTANAETHPSFQAIEDDQTLKVTAHNYASMSILVRTISRMVQKPVVDLTEISGSYDYVLTCATEHGAPAENAEPAAVPSIFTALQDQLGLKLEPRRVPVKVFSIDHVERPTG